MALHITLNNGQKKSEIAELVERMSGQSLAACYQCGNCTGSCPVSEMDLPPSQIIRFLQLGQDEKVMSANSMWVCVACLQCYSRCPKCINPSGILEALRRISLQRGQEPAPVKALSSEFIKHSPQQAIVAGFRKLVP